MSNPRDGRAAVTPFPAPGRFTAHRRPFAPSSSRRLRAHSSQAGGVGRRRALAVGEPLPPRTCGSAARHRLSRRAAGGAARGRDPHRDQRQPRADVGRAHVLQPEPPPARGRAAISAARRAERGRAWQWTSTASCATRCRSTRRAARRVRGHHPRADRSGAPLGHAGQQLQAERVSDPARNATRSSCCATRRRSRARNGKQLYRLPLYYGDGLPAALARRARCGHGQRAAVASGALGSPGFESRGRRVRNGRHAPRLPGRGVLEIDVPAPASAAGVHAGPSTARTYFHAEVPVAASKAPRALPRSVTLVWDSSGSGRSRDHGREFALLDAYFAKARNVELRWCASAMPRSLRKRSGSSNGDWQALRRALAATIYDGATDLGAFASDPGRGRGAAVLRWARQLRRAALVRNVNVPLYADLRRSARRRRGAAAHGGTKRRTLHRPLRRRPPPRPPTRCSPSRRRIVDIWTAEGATRTGGSVAVPRAAPHRHRRRAHRSCRHAARHRRSSGRPAASDHGP